MTHEKYGATLICKQAMIVRKGNISWKRNVSTWRNIRCFIGLHNGWQRDVYVNDATPFLYCPNCHQQRVPDFYTPMDIPPPTHINKIGAELHSQEKGEG